MAVSYVVLLVFICLMFSVLYRALFYLFCLVTVAERTNYVVCNFIPSLHAAIHFSVVVYPDSVCL